VCRVRFLEVGQVVVDEMWKWLRWVHALLSSSALPCDPREAPIRQWYNKRDVRSAMPGLLSVVATPIGNLEDITLRALRVLREADLIAAEDTRHTAKLLSHHGLRTRMLSFHAHNTRSRLPQIIERLTAGAQIALVTDAGTPGVSDPGAELVEAARNAGIKVEVIPGPSASLAAAVASGFPLVPLTILGFPPVRSIDRKRWFDGAAEISHTLTFFEAPHRIEATLRSCAKYFAGRDVLVARELTKIHEEVSISRAQDLINIGVRARGEFTLVVSPAILEKPEASVSDEGILAKYLEVAARMPDGSRRDVVVQVAAELGLSRRAVYPALERAKPER
jgi:16S rRNA (cytidine1402-2'-O)-methyltransferase